jgi:hypothetical protein
MLKRLIVVFEQSNVQITKEPAQPEVQQVTKPEVQKKRGRPKK